MNKYVAYVSSYTQNEKFGITIFDVDMKKGRFTKKGVVEVSNSSYITISHSQKFLYTITDLGVEGAVEKASHEEVQKAAAAAQPIMAMLVREMINRFEEL